METLFYLARYAFPVLGGLGSVGAAAILNHVLGARVWVGRVAEPMEVLAYSVRITGPIVFGFAFMTLFYGIEAAREGSPFSKAAFGVGLVLLAIVLVLNVIFIPKLGSD